MSAEEGKALVLKAEGAPTMPPIAMLWVWDKESREEFYAEAMQAHNGRTIFTGVRKKAVLECKAKRIPMLRKSELPSMSNGAMSLFTFPVNSVSTEYHHKRPLRVMNSDHIGDVVGVSSLDDLKTWAVTSREDAARQNDDKIERVIKETKETNARLFAGVVSRLVYHRMRKEFKERPFYKKWFGAKGKLERDMERCVAEKDSFFMECAAEVFRAEGDVEYDMEILEKEVGFLP